MNRGQLIHNVSRFYVLCEGESEQIYLIELNRFFQEEDIPLNFIPILVGNGSYSKLKSEWNKFQKNNSGQCRDWRKLKHVFFLADFDLFARNTENSMELYIKEKDTIPEIMFNRHNFEDFLSLHLSFEKACEWCTTCSTIGHPDKPLHARTYEPLFCEFLPGYRKGTFPPGFDLKEGLSHLKSNLERTDKKLYQRSDFGIFLVKQLDHLNFFAS